MVHRGSFQGSRKVFLIGEKVDYAAGVEGGFAAEALSKIQRRYFKRYPVELPHEEEPTSEHLESVDDNKPEPEQEAPDVDLLGEHDFAVAMKELQTRRVTVTFRKAQIKRWLAYQYMKDHDLDPKDSGVNNPYRILLYQLTGVKLPRPRLKTPANVWRKTQRGPIDEEVARRMGIVSSENSRRKDLVSTRDKVAREMYQKLPEVERDEWAEQAREEHQAAMETWQAELNKKPSTDPVARQKCIHGLTRFVQPILDSIVEATGWKVSLIAGGPEPADEGRLNIISIHSGATPGDVRMNFGCAERAHYKKYVVPAFGSFLRKCYTVEDCHSRALPESSGFPSLSTLDLDEDGVNFDAVPGVESATTSEPSERSSALLPAPPRLVPPSRPANPPGLPVHLTASPAPQFSAIRPSNLHSTPQRPPSVPRYSPALDSCPPSPSRSSATSRRLSPSSAVVPPISSSEGTLSSSSDDAASLTVNSSPCTTLSRHSTAASSLPSDTAPSAFTDSTARIPRSSHAAASSPTPPSAVSAASGQPPHPHIDVVSIHSSNTSTNNLSGLASTLAPTDAVIQDAVERDLTNARSTQQRSKRLRSESIDTSAPGSSSKRPRPATTNITEAFTSNSSIQPRQLRSTARAHHTSPLPVSKHAHPTMTPPSPTVSNTPRSSSLSCPHVEQPSLPEWFTSAKLMFEGESLGDQWLELVKLWSLFEERGGFAGDGYLPSKNRPHAVAQWIKRKRPRTWRPTFNLTAYEEDFRLWWTSLQPEWRVMEDTITLENVEGDWSVLQKPGINGIVSVLAAVFFWGCHIIEVNEDRDMWSLIVDDCIQALSHLVAM